MAETERASSEGPAFANVDWKQQEDQDEAEISKMLAGVASGEETSIFNKVEGAPPELKADDAIDYEDFDDDELPDEEEATGPSVTDVPGLTDDGGTSNDNDMDDLFGENEDRASSPFDLGVPTDVHDDMTVEHGDGPEPAIEEEENLWALNFGAEGARYASGSNQDLSIPPPAESNEALVGLLYPTFEKGVVLNWTELLPTKRAYFIPKVPLKAPKPVNPTKVSLELAPDQEKAFRTADSSLPPDNQKRLLEAEAKGLVPIIEDSAGEKSDDEDLIDWDLPTESDQLGGVSWTDLQIICDDWDSKINSKAVATRAELVEEEPLDEWDRDILGHSSKRRKLVQEEQDYMNIPRFDIPSFDDLERSLAAAAHHVMLDLNDPHLLVDYQPMNHGVKRSQPGGNTKAVKNGLQKVLKNRFNISNDDAYDALKENHQSKVRAALGNLAVEHSLPALRLQWPYYKVKMELADQRKYHRPGPMAFNTFIGKRIDFSAPGMRKRKQVKSLTTHQIFSTTKDLSLSEHYSSAALLEYSEEHPIVLSNFGMGNRIINYYRKMDNLDPAKPVSDDKVGELSVLLPEDKSPFSNFGIVAPGETVKTLHNAMYRAPIFKHEPKGTDFLVIRNSDKQRSDYYIRNIDHLYAVGQQFPSIEIPGPHSRRVTNAAKFRMRRIAYRTIRKNEEKGRGSVLNVKEVGPHFEGSDIQNRQKLKEFLHYDKESKVWRLKPGDGVPDDSVLREMIKPEDICLIDAQQVGSRFLEDAGFAAPDKEEVDDAVDGEGLTLDEHLAPWKTSKAFLEASADKAMLKLHGDGDPSGHGTAISMIKTSMKGGYLGALQGPSATSAAAMESERKANGGHQYNVKKQQMAYKEAISEIWHKQKDTLSDPNEHAENELEREQADEDDRLGPAPTPRAMATPAAFDDSVSQISRFSREDRQGKFMRITRTKVNVHGQTEEVSETITDASIWREYQKRRHEQDAGKTDVYMAKPTGNVDFDKQEQLRIKKELDRLQRNKERRQAREKQKSKQLGLPPPVPEAGSPSGTPAPSIEKVSGTTRKCANCGQAGHIKTNKKYCNNCADNPFKSFSAFGSFSASQS